MNISVLYKCEGNINNRISNKSQQGYTEKLYSLFQPLHYNNSHNTNHKLIEYKFKTIGNRKANDKYIDQESIQSSSRIKECSYNNRCQTQRCYIYVTCIKAHNKGSNSHH